MQPVLVSSVVKSKGTRVASTRGCVGSCRRGPRGVVSGSVWLWSVLTGSVLAWLVLASWVASAGVGSGPGSAGAEFVGCAVGSPDVDLTGGRVEGEPPSSFVNTYVMEPTAT